jgi:hypothetical protein
MVHEAAAARVRSVATLRIRECLEIGFDVAREPAEPPTPVNACENGEHSEPPATTRNRPLHVESGGREFRGWVFAKSDEVGRPPGSGFADLDLDPSEALRFHQPQRAELNRACLAVGRSRDRRSAQERRIAAVAALGRGLSHKCASLDGGKHLRIPHPFDGSNRFGVPARVGGPATWFRHGRC